MKINTPHYLAKLDGVTKGTSMFTVIVSQLESLSTIYYTLKVQLMICNAAAFHFGSIWGGGGVKSCGGIVSVADCHEHMCMVQEGLVICLTAFCSCLFSYF